MRYLKLRRTPAIRASQSHETRVENKQVGGHTLAGMMVVGIQRFEPLPPKPAPDYATPNRHDHKGHMGTPLKEKRKHKQLQAFVTQLLPQR